MNKYILALDQGTTSCRAVVINKNGEIISVAQKEFTQIFPHASWVEHDANEIWNTQWNMAKEALAKANITSEQIASIGITNQRETTVVWNRETGEPIYNAIVWQDKRTADFCDKIYKDGKAELIREKTGLVVDAYFSATKVNWILDNVEDARFLAENGQLAWGTIDSWLVWKLTNGQEHITDVSNASRSMLFNIHSLQWDDALLDIFDVPTNMFPHVRSSSEVYGKTAEGIFDSSIPIAGIAGDQQAALFGQMCTQKGMVKNTYGTGCFMLMNIGQQPTLSKNNLLTTVAWKINGETSYALEGSIFIGGAVVQWLRDSLSMINTSSEVESLANKVESSEGVYFVPAFAGLGAPHWDQHAKGSIFGLTRGSTDAHIATAALESIAFQTMDVLKAMEADSGISINELRVDGGATVNNKLMQFQADVLNTTTVRPKIVETTVMGAAYLAGLAVGYWQSQEEIQAIWQTDKKYSPTEDQENMKSKIEGWERAVSALQHWSSHSTKNN